MNVERSSPSRRSRRKSGSISLRRSSLQLESRRKSSSSESCYPRTARTSKSDIIVDLESRDFDVEDTKPMYLISFYLVCIDQGHNTSKCRLITILANFVTIRNTTSRDCSRRSRRNFSPETENIDERWDRRSCIRGQQGEGFSC